MLNQLNKSKEKRWPSSLNTFSIWLSYTKNNAPYTRRQKHCFDVVSLLNVLKNDVVENDQQRKKKKQKQKSNENMPSWHIQTQWYSNINMAKQKNSNETMRAHEFIYWIEFDLSYGIVLVFTMTEGHSAFFLFSFFVKHLIADYWDERKLLEKNGLVNKQDLHKSELQDSQKVFMRSYAIKMWVWQCE